ncbi:TonB family protein [Solimonas sp. K1W22B-7]|uniref:TonB family protein n=1 Tax=Solimonas sp. K1W22B-7 TaxID=2303331 RepID=UPI0013C4AB81|nr:TonB family protein [Solimonas sp. K1W22B-7]
MRVVALLAAALLAACARNPAQPGPVAAAGQAEPSRLARAQQDWAADIGRQVRRHWQKPTEDAPGNFGCQVHVELESDGAVRLASLARSCGSDALDRSLLMAVQEASPLPLPVYAPAFDPVLNITFCLHPGVGC